MSNMFDIPEFMYYNKDENTCRAGIFRRFAPVFPCNGVAKLNYPSWVP